MSSVFIAVLSLSIFVLLLVRLISRNESVGSVLDTKNHQARRDAQKKNLLDNLFDTSASKNSSAHYISETPKKDIEKNLKLMQKFPRASRYQLRLAALYSQIGDYANAYTIYTKLEKNNALEKSGSSSENALHLLNFSIALVEKGNIPKAKNLIDVCQKVIPQNPEVTFLQGKLAFLEGNYGEAMNNFAILERQPKYYDRVRYYWALGLYYAGEYARAIPQLEEELAVSSSSELNFAMADSIHQTSGMQRNIDAYLSPLVNDPEWTTKAAMLEGENLSRRGDQAKAISLYQKSIRIQPLVKVEEESTLEIRYRLALCLLEERMVEDAVTLLQEIYVNQPNYKNVEILIEQYREMAENSAIYDYVSGAPEKVSIVCQKIITALYKGTVLHVENFDVDPGAQEAKMTVQLESRKHSETILFIFKRSAVEVLKISDITSIISLLNQERAVVITYGEIEPGLRQFLEGRPVDLIDRIALSNVLRSLK